MGDTLIEEPVENKEKADMAHTTVQEKKFLDSLGTHCEKSARRDVLLKHYLAAAKLRTDWGDIDSVLVIAHARALLKAWGFLMEINSAEL